MGSKKYLVPHDFSHVGDTALNHALNAAKTTGGSVLLLHVVPKPAEVDDAKERLEAMAAKCRKAENVPVEAIVRIGNIFEDIDHVAEEVDAEMIFMGTHGAKGWQKISGSRALKVVTNSSTPFVIVQSKPIKATGYDDIVVPLDLDATTKQKLVIVVSMARYFKSKVHIITPFTKDSEDRTEIKINLAFAQKYLKDNGIEFTHTVASEDGTFDREIIKFAARIDADLIAIMNKTGDKIGGDIFATSSEQMIITNDAQVAVVLLNPSVNTRSGSVLFQ
ncbi:MAG: universal stress protein [Flavobacteriales bacterium]